MASEKEAMMKLKILVQKFVSESIPLQISTLYATQVFCHDKQFPKGWLIKSKNEPVDLWSRKKAGNLL